jgi:type I restriction enzyme S subunit
MAGEWKRTSLRDAGVKLIDCDHRTPPAASDGYPYVAIPQLKGGRLDLAEVRRISREHFTDWTRKAKPQHHDVILSRRCNPGETAYVPEGVECALGQNLVLLRADGTKLFPPFLRWLVRGTDWWEQVGKFINVGAVFDSLRCADIPKFEIPLPPLGEQKAIAAVLRALDDKIELNRRMNATLEAMARALFQSWFVDFDPVGAKLDGRQSAGLDPATAALFPDEFERSKLGHIPKGWQVVPLENLASVRGGKQLPTEECLPTGKFTVFGANGVMGYTAESTHEGFVIAFGRVGAYCGSIHWSLDGAWINNNASAVVPLRWPAFILQTILNIEFDSMRTGSAQPFIPNSSLAAAEVLCPSSPVVEAFGRIVEPLRRRQADNDIQSRTLAAMRDALLPKLLSGALHVSNDANE